jgi:hypothetical protein
MSIKIILLNVDISNNRVFDTTIFYMAHINHIITNTYTANIVNTHSWSRVGNYTNVIKQNKDEALSACTLGDFSPTLYFTTKG